MIDNRISGVTILWLQRLRWVAVFAQLTSVFIAYLLDWKVSFLLLLLVAVFTAVSNAFFTRLPPDRSSIFAALALDVVLLTLLLIGSGGATSPFSMLYLVHMTLTAVLLDSRSMWVLSGLSIVCYGALFLLPRDEHIHQSIDAFSLHLYGMWIAFSLTAVALSYFVARISESLAARERELASAREYASRAERLASLSTLAAGAAHELSTPLATIAVSAKELEHFATQQGDAATLHEEATLIRAEVERCRAILNRMRAQAGESVGETASNIEPEELCRLLTEALGPKLSARVVLSISEDVVAPKYALIQSLVNLIRNGLDASTKPVSVSLHLSEENASFEVRDQGPQVSVELLERVGEPFFTTKPPGLGMGLGFFLSNNFATMLGGKCWLESSPNGTTATLQIPKVAAKFSAPISRR
jgi:two-component system sensor histidine kinase RegB